LDLVAGDAGGDALELFQEIDVEEGAALLAVGHGLQAAVLLNLHDVANALVLDGAQRGAVDTFLREVLAGLLEGGGAQQAAHVVGAEGRVEFHEKSFNCAGAGPASWLARRRPGVQRRTHDSRRKRRAAAPAEILPGCDASPAPSGLWPWPPRRQDRESTRLNSSHVKISYA